MSETAKENPTSITEFDKLWNYNDPEETEKKFRELLPKIKDSNDRSAYLQLLTQIARTNSLRMKFDEAHKVLDEAEPQLSDELHLARIRYLLERGRTFRSSMQVEKSRDFFIKAYELSVENKEDNYAVDAAHMMGIIEPFDEAQRWNELAMKSAENSLNPGVKNWLGSLYNNTAWNYHDNREYDKALNLFEKNVVWHTEKKSGQELIIAKWSVARTLRSLNKIEEAIKMQNDLLKEMKEKELEEDGYIYEELGELYLLKDNKEESKKNFAKAYDILSKDIWLAENEKERLERMKALSE